jgi:hypothetical protein
MKEVSDEKPAVGNRKRPPAIHQKDVENKRSFDFTFIQLLIRFPSAIMSFVT